ncbi:MAG: hypothetical protein Q9159_005256 [Coniocarpon cinnabarinum]
MHRISKKIKKLRGDKPKKDPPASSAEAGSSQPETVRDKIMSPFVQLDPSEAKNVHDITFEQAHQSLDAINEKARTLQKYPDSPGEILLIVFGQGAEKFREIMKPKHLFSTHKEQQKPPNTFSRNEIPRLIVPRHTKNERQVVEHLIQASHGYAKVNDIDHVRIPWFGTSTFTDDVGMAVGLGADFEEHRKKVPGGVVFHFDPYKREDRFHFETLYPKNVTAESGPLRVLAIKEGVRAENAHSESSDLSDSEGSSSTN